MTKGVSRKAKSTETRRKTSGAPPEMAPAAARGREDRPSVSHDQIAERAYLLYLERGAGHGQDLEDWLRAEAELTAGRAGNGNGKAN
jgi:hypothetical protein